eukprot:4086008-Amphidinium_carterae.1
MKSCQCRNFSHNTFCSSAKQVGHVRNSDTTLCLTFSNNKCLVASASSSANASAANCSVIRYTLLELEHISTVAQRATAQRFTWRPL